MERYKEKKEKKERKRRKKERNKESKMRKGRRKEDLRLLPLISGVPTVEVCRAKG